MIIETVIDSIVNVLLGALSDITMTPLPQVVTSTANQALSYLRTGVNVLSVFTYYDIVVYGLAIVLVLEVLKKGIWLVSIIWDATKNLV